MIDQAIRTEALNNVGLATLLNAGSGTFHLYPVRIPEDVNADHIVSFQEISQRQTYPKAIRSLFQFNCYGSTLANARQLQDFINEVFDDRKSILLGGIFELSYSKFESVTTFYEEKAKRFVAVVEVSFFYKNSV